MVRKILSDRRNSNEVTWISNIDSYFIHITQLTPRLGGGHDDPAGFDHGFYKKKFEVTIPENSWLFPKNECWNDSDKKKVENLVCTPLLAHFWDALFSILAMWGINSGIKDMGSLILASIFQAIFPPFLHNFISYFGCGLVKNVLASSTPKNENHDRTFNRILDW